MRFLIFSFFLSLILLSGDSFSQDQPTVSDSFEIHKVLVIPFSPKMYISDADKDLMIASELSFPQLVARLRSGISIAVRQRIPGWWESELLADEKDSISDLEYVYASVTYKYELLDEKTSGAKKSVLKKNEPEEKPKIVKGQLHVEQDNRPKFMNIHLKSDTLLSHLAENHGADYFLFLNQLDFESDLSDYAETGNKTFKRKAKIHYTILDKNGKQIFAGLSFVSVPAKKNKVEEIIAEYFPEAAKGVTAHLPPPIPIKKPKKK